jgi:Uma2 family endonuclease
VAFGNLVSLHEPDVAIVLRALLPNHERAEHSMAMPAIRRRWTTAAVRALTDDWRQWPRYELIDGELLVTPAPGTAHQIAIVELIALLHAHLQNERIGVVVASPADLELQSGTITQPDVFVIPAHSVAGGDEIHWPDVKSLLLAVEVISPSSVRIDRVVKRDFYLDAGVPEYWVVDVDARIIERWTQSQDTPTIVRHELTWNPAGVGGLVIDVGALFERIAATLGTLMR